MSGKTKLVAFDMDGTLVEAKSSWAALHNEFKTDSKEMLDRYMKGEITDEEFVEYDIKIWEEKTGGLNIEKIYSVLDKIEIRNGAKELLSKINKMEIKTVIISGGVSYLAKRVAEELGIAEYYANDILEDENGRVYGKINLNGRDKGAVLRKIMDDNNLRDNEVVAVGDEKNDIGMFEIAGTSIAVNTKNVELIEKSTYYVEEENLLEILKFIGVNNDDE